VEDLERCSGDFFDLGLDGKIEELVTNLDLDSSNDGGIDLRANHNFGGSLGSRLDGGGDSIGLPLGERIRADDGRVDFSTLGLHQGPKDVGDLGKFRETGVSGQGFAQIRGDQRDVLFRQQCLDLGGLIVSGNQRVFQKAGKGRGFGGGLGKTIELRLDLVE